MVTTTDGTEISRRDYDWVSQLLRKGAFSDEEFKEGLRIIEGYKTLLWSMSRHRSKYLLDEYVRFEIEYCLRRWNCSPECIDVFQHREVLARFVLENDVKVMGNYNPSVIAEAVINKKSKCLPFSY